jgi:glycosyltransferase involved in cell wall biosynthesis
VKLQRGVVVFLQVLIAIPGAVVVVLATALLPKRRSELVWGTTPIANIKYWSAAMRAAGWDSHTLVSTVYESINRRDDFDLVEAELLPRFFPSRVRRALGPYAGFLHVLRHAAVLHISFLGGPLGATPLRRWEAQLLRLARIRTVAIPFGADVFVYSRIEDPSFRYGLLRSYPQAGRDEHKVEARVRYWCRRADVIVVGFTIDGLPRWDVAAGNIVVIDAELWPPRTTPSVGDGRSGRVRILHTPNHRGAKGTEFLIAAVDELRDEGLDVELVLAERIQNERVRELMREVDILGDQLIVPGYGLAAIEGMASALPVICNLEYPRHVALLDRYSFLGECPVVSATPESVKAVLRVLVTEPGLREELGRAGRAFVEKYQSYETAQHLFGAIYDRVLKNQDVDLATLFHPVLSDFNRRLPRVEHPLVEHRLPQEWLDTAMDAPTLASPGGAAG